jgi:predicted PurR-regulated permease PerM
MGKNKFYIKILFIGIFLILIQSFFQNLESLQGIIKGFYNYLRPFIYGLLIAVVLEPLVNFFSKRLSLKRNLGICFAFLVFLIILVGIFFIILPPVSKSFSDLIGGFPSMRIKSQAWVIKIFDTNRGKFSFIDENIVKEKLINLIGSQVINTQIFMTTVIEEIIKLTFSAVDIFFGFLIATYFLSYKEYFINFIRKTLSIFFRKETVIEVVDFLFEGKDIFINYLLGRALVSLAVGIICFLIMFFTGVPYALLIALVIGLGNMIPYIGSIIAGLISTILVLLTIPLKTIPLWIAILIAQQIDSWILGPKILGHSVGMSPFWVVTAVLIGGNIGGAVGMLMGVPIFALFKVLYHKILDKKGIVI